MDAMRSVEMETIAKKDDIHNQTLNIDMGLDGEGGKYAA